MALERSAHLLRLFGAHADGDGLIGAANDLAAATADLLEPEPLLRLTVLPLLIEILSSTRADVRLAACVALRTACRVEAVQQEGAVLGAAPPLTKALSTGPAEVQLEACKAAEAIARHDAGREALAEAGEAGERALLRFVVKLFVFPQTCAEPHRLAQRVEREKLLTGNPCDLAVEGIGAEINGGDGGLLRHFSVLPASFPFQLPAWFTRSA
jgi:hypothetical protein